MSKWLQNVYYFVLGSILLLCSTALAINGRTTYQAKIYKPDGLPLEAVSVNFRFTVLDPSSSCVLYVEDYAAVNMIGSGGLTSFSLGMGTRTYPASGPVTFASVFDNSTPSYVCQVPGVYNPIPTDNRKIVMQFNEGSGWQTLPAMAINSVPYSMYSAKAQNAQQLNGKADTSFVEYSALASLNCQTNEAIKFNGVSFSCIAVGVGSSGISSVTTSGTVLTTTGTASAPVISINVASMSSDGYLTSVDYAEFKAKLSASSTQIVNTLGYAPVSGAAVNSQIQASQLSGDVSGTVSANIVQSVGGKTAAQVSTSVNDTLGATSSATADTIVKRNASGNITVNDIYANAAKVNYVDIYKPSTSFNIRLEAPTSLAANYTLALPTTSGSVGQVLSTDGSGNLSWINPSTGSVTSVSAVAPLSSTGGATPTISISQVTSSTNGYLSSADWNTFNNKQQATSAAIIATLGYTPANATSSTQWTTNGSHIYYSTGNVGIGVSNPVNALDVFGTVRAGAADNGSVSMGNDGNAFMELREYDNAGTPYIDFANDNSIDYDARFILSGDDTFELNGAMFGIGLRPTAVLSLAAGTATYGPLKFASGTLLTSPQSGTMEYDGSNFFLTDGANQRRVIATGSSQGSIDNASNINSSSNITMTPNNSVIVSSTAASTNSSTGALIVKGGLGVVGDIYTSGTIVTSSNIQGVSVTATSGMISPYIYGSTVSGGALTLDSTTHATKGNVLIAPNGGSVGIGTASPSTRLDVRITSTDNVAGPTATAYPVASFINNSSGGGQRGLEIGAPTGGFSSPVYIKVSGTSNRLAFLNSSSSETLTIADNGSVGIGTSNPTHALDFQGTVADFALTRSVNSAAAPDIYFQKDRGTVGNPSVMQNGDALGNIGFRGYDGANYIRGALIQVRATSAPATNQMTADMIFSTNNGAADASERMRITAAGNVGIGTANPQNPLHVIGSIKATGNMGNLVVNTSGQQMEPGDATLTTLRFDSANYRIWNPSLGELLRVQSNGYVGIGTSSATAKLSIYSGDDGSMDSVQIHGGSLSASRYGVLNVHDTSEYIRLGYYNGSAMKNIFLDGSVGIGTATPAAKFEISNSTSSVMRVLAGTGNGVDDDNLLRMMPQNSTGEGGHIELKGSASNQDWTIDTVAGELRIFEPGQSRNAVKTRGGVTFSINTSVTSTAAVVDALKIASSGYVGLGTNTPQAKLDIFGSTYFASRKGYANYYNVGPYDQMEFGAVGPTTALSLVTSGISRLNITPTGDVGIGTSSPMTNLQLPPSGYIGLPANGYPYIPAAWKRGNGGGMIFANSQNSDGSGWSYGTRIVNHDYGDGLALSFDSLYTGAWTNDVLVVSGRSGLARVGIGTALPSEKLHVVGNLRVQGSTDCTLGNGAGGTNCSSDARLKENIKPIPYALEKVISLKGVEFDWNAKSVSQGRHDIGVIAQDVEKVFPTAVMNDQNTGYKKVDYAVLVAPLIQAFKEFYAFVVSRFDRYDRQIASKADAAAVEVLKVKTEKLEAENLQLKQQNEAIKAYLCAQNPAASICQ